MVKFVIMDILGRVMNLNRILTSTYIFVHLIPNAGNLCSTLYFFQTLSASVDLIQKASDGIYKF